ncbi:MAG: hypothetical protein ACD_2C00209G0007 [uncultured bacterium (gcode 4)]|uniref:Uncharacterized protein n=1 Tax=uncultured bacterium (gcode 4) TaxID=1234023 RepID=K2G1X9_9BACT|nr:MAG: hypothetical protein ACD_2C00209G0007 [uncultured bacterium (gcode 4)]
MRKKDLKIISYMSMIPLVLQSMSVYAFIWEDTSLDFFKTIDKWSISTQLKFIENELEWSAQKINDYVLSKMGLSWSDIKFINPQKDFTKSELDKISEDWNIWLIIWHLDSSQKEISSDTLKKIQDLIIEWYRSKQWEMMKKEASMSRIAVTGLYNDWSKENSWYDIMDDLTKIHDVIFSKETKYEWTENGNSLEFWNILNWSMNNIWAAFDEDKPLNNSLWIMNNWNQGNNQAAWSGQTSNWTSIQQLSDDKSKSNLCLTWAGLWLLDDSIMEDIASQLSNGESSSSSQGWVWNSNWENSYSMPTSWSWNNWGWWGGNDSGWWGGSIFDTFPCSGIFCIEISAVVYKQNLLWGWKSESIEWILDKNLKIVNSIAWQSLIQSDMTKNFFSLSILRKLNLPSMVYLWMVVTHLPPPILNLQPKSWKEPNELLDESIFESTFKQNWLDYKMQNAFNPEYEAKIMKACEWMDSQACLWKQLDYQTIYNPVISNSNILLAKIWENYGSSVNDDIAELIGFSNTFKTNIKQISDTVIKMNKK